MHPIHVTAPGRVNLIGEHTDYTGGLVMPLAIPFETKATIAAADDYIFRSTGFPGETRIARHETRARHGLWSDYPVGVLDELLATGIDIPGFQIDFDGNVPLGAGLSSSASVEVAACTAMLQWAGQHMEAKDIALLCQRAENRFVGSPCGIMDQFVSVAAEAGHALLLHTRTLHYEQVPMNTGDLAQTCLVVCNSDVKHSVAAGEYGVRRRQLEEGQAVLRKTFPIADLGEATLEQLESCREQMSPQAFRRCRHIISENTRVRAAAEAMRAGDAKSLGEFMTAAHESERDDFECSTEEIDFLVETAIALPGCLGARLTGGGFGGCTVNLVEREAAPAFEKALQSAYRQRFGIHADTFVCEAVDGAYARAKERA